MVRNREGRTDMIANFVKCRRRVSYKAEFDGFLSSVLSNVDYMNTLYSHHELETIRAAVRTIGRLPKN
jgi:hypothetical protein